MAVEIIPGNTEFIESFFNALTKVAAEEIYIEMVTPPPFVAVQAFQTSLIEKKAPVFYAVEGDKVVGWCDISLKDNPRQRHRGQLGMGLLPDYRGQGIGTKLLETSLKQASEIGLEKVELCVFTSNTAAINLYEKFGFEREGLIKKYRRLRDTDFDCFLMAKSLEL